MASAFEISVVGAQAMLNALVDLCDGGAGAATIGVRTGGPPATTLTADSGTLLATLTMTDPAFGNASSAAPSVATAASISSDTSADASGDAGHFRIYDSNSVCIMQGTAGEAADSTDMTFDDKSIVLGGTVAISSLTVSMPTE